MPPTRCSRTSASFEQGGQGRTALGTPNRNDQQVGLWVAQVAGLRHRHVDGFIRGRDR